MNKRRWSDEDLMKAVPLCTSFSEVASFLGMSRSIVTSLKQKSIELSLDTSHFRISGYKSKPIHSKSSTHKTKLRLLKENYFEYKCYSCNLTEWLNTPIPLELEHIDGNRYNFDLNNLTLLCPNCHALTPTYRGKNKNKYKLKGV